MPNSRNNTLLKNAMLTQPIVLVQNEVTIDPQYESWLDETGKRYHFPNAYINLIIEGRQFLYHRGARTAFYRVKSFIFFVLNGLVLIPDRHIVSSAAIRPSKAIANPPFFTMANPPFFTMKDKLTLGTSPSVESGFCCLMNANPISILS